MAIRILLWVIINLLDLALFEKFSSFPDYAISTIFFFLFYGIYFYYASLKTDNFVSEITSSVIIYLLWFSIFKLFLIGSTYLYSQYLELFGSIIIHFVYFLLLVLGIKNLHWIFGIIAFFQSAHKRYLRSK